MNEKLQENQCPTLVLFSCSVGRLLESLSSNYIYVKTKPWHDNTLPITRTVYNYLYKQLISIPYVTQGFCQVYVLFIVNKKTFPQ